MPGARKIQGAHARWFRFQIPGVFACVAAMAVVAEPVMAALPNAPAMGGEIDLPAPGCQVVLE
ncbi:MAG: hypothetical protein HoeaKO_39340 [Hoeflea alexandrii]